MPNPDLIDQLVADNRPVRAMRTMHGRMIFLLSAAMAVALALIFTGARHDLMTFDVPAATLLHWGIWLILALACGFTSVGSAMPEVGSDRHSWRWASAMAMLLPVLGAIALVRNPALLDDPLWRKDLVQCFVRGIAAGSLTLAALVLWLRRGAPVFPERAGLLAGVSAGAVGTFAYSLHCTLDEPAHNGLVHALPVIASALIGRLVVPPLLRW